MATGDAVRIMPDQNIPEAACEFRFVHASGPGGQHVNKTSSAVELRVRIDLLELPYEVVRRLRQQQKNRINKAGELVIQAEQFRSQHKNRQAALERLQDMLELARRRPKRRIATKPSYAAKQKRLDHKKQRGATKHQRRKPRLD